MAHLVEDSCALGNFPSGSPLVTPLNDSVTLHLAGPLAHVTRYIIQELKRRPIKSVQDGGSVDDLEVLGVETVAHDKLHQVVGLSITFHLV